MARPNRPTTGYSRPPHFKFIEAIGRAVAVIGLAVIAAGFYFIFDRPDRWGVGLVIVAVGVGLVLLGLDVVARPRARRLPRMERLLDFILRLRSGMGP